MFPPVGSMRIILFTLCFYVRNAFNETFIIPHTFYWNVDSAKMTRCEKTNINSVRVLTVLMIDKKATESLKQRNTCDRTHCGKQLSLMQNIQ